MKQIVWQLLSSNLNCQAEEEGANAIPSDILQIGVKSGALSRYWSNSFLIAGAEYNILATLGSMHSDSLSVYTFSFDKTALSI